MNLSRRYRTSSEVTFQRLEDATVIVHLGTGRIHHTNLTGSRIWELLDSGRSLEEILHTLEGEFDVDPEELRSQMEQFVERLESDEMIAGDAT